MTNMTNFDIDCILGDCYTLGQLANMCSKEQKKYKLQVTKKEGKRFLEISLGDASTSSGWFTQMISRNYNQILNKAEANRFAITEHLKNNNDKLESYISRANFLIKQTKDLSQLESYQDQKNGILDGLHQELNGIQALLEIYHDEETQTSLKHIAQKIRSLVNLQLKEMEVNLQQKVHRLAINEEKRIEEIEKIILKREEKLLEKLKGLLVDKTLSLSLDEEKSIAN